LALLATFFGAQALIIFKKYSIRQVIDKLNSREKHKHRLFYSTVLLGSTLSALSIIQGGKYLVGINISTSYIELFWSVVYLSLLGSAYSWYGFMKDIDSV
jgi:hypothetical protein